MKMVKKGLAFILLSLSLSLWGVCDREESRRVGLWKSECCGAAGFPFVFGSDSDRVNHGRIEIIIIQI